MWRGSLWRCSFCLKQNLVLSSHDDWPSLKLQKNQFEVLVHLLEFNEKYPKFMLRWWQIMTLLSPLSCYNDLCSPEHVVWANLHCVENIQNITLVSPKQSVGLTKYIISFQRMNVWYLKNNDLWFIAVQADLWDINIPLTDTAMMINLRFFSQH